MREDRLLERFKQRESEGQILGKLLSVPGAGGRSLLEQIGKLFVVRRYDDYLEGPFYTSRRLQRMQTKDRLHANRGHRQKVVARRRAATKAKRRQHASLRRR